MKHLVIYLIILFTGFKSFANERQVVFKVLATSGITLVERVNDKENWKPINSGTKLYHEDKIIITEGSYLGIIHVVSGKSLELKVAGVYSVNDLEDRVDKKQLGFLQNYVDDLFAELVLNEKPQYVSDIIKENTTRSVIDNLISVDLPEKAKLLDNNLELSWNKFDQAKKYRVEILNLYEDVLFKTETEDTFTTVDCSNLDLQQGEYYLLRVELTNKSKINSGKISFEYDPDNKGVLNEVKSRVDTNSSIGYLILANYFEDKGFYLDALQSYKRAVSISPRVEAYQSAYSDFRERHFLR